MARAQNGSISVIPSARRLVHSLRDLGYDFPQAVADLADNSITAGATRIQIDLMFDGPDSWCRIVDNGHGMSGPEITEAMRYGAQQSYGDEDLGKFGLGLKTASLSQCRRLTVASRRSNTRARIEVRQLDLDHVLEADRWEIFDLGSRCRDARVIEPLKARTGTVVLWESLDRLLGYKIPWGKRAQNALSVLSDQLVLHLGMTFHRFIEGEIEGRPPLRILVNGRRVPPWDPFARGETATIELPGCDIDIETTEGVGLVRFQPYVLPPREGFSSDDAFHRLAGPRKWNAQQGLYIYRANRMVQSGGWCRMRAPDEHLKLARASIDFFPDLDAAFGVNVSKARAILPSGLRERLRDPVDELARVAQSAYREHAGAALSGTRAPRSAKDLRRALESAARRAGASRALKSIISELRSSSPAAARRIGW